MCNNPILESKQLPRETTMSLATTYSRALVGIQAPLITIEAHLSSGLPKFSIVGLPETIIKESKDRVRSAIINSAFLFPDRRITVNLAPADLPKLGMGSRFDLPIALAILAASGQIPTNALADYEFVGELTLSGATRPISGILPLALALKVEKIKAPENNRLSRYLILPQANIEEAALVKNSALYPAKHLLDVCQHLQNNPPIKCYVPMPPNKNQRLKNKGSSHTPLDLSDVLGQEYAKRALTIAAAGRHSLLMAGPPGCGKSMLAKRLLSILPNMTEIEALESAAIYSIAGKTILHSFEPNNPVRPYRSPHHTTSSIALVGGSNPPRPGEISYAHQGILFLDELPEFNRKTLETLREPLEQGKITIARAAHVVEFPAKFQLIAAMNPCPCGYYGDLNKPCECSPNRVKAYLQRLSGPLLDRIDLHISLKPVPLKHFKQTKNTRRTTSKTIKKQVESAYQFQLKWMKRPAAYLSEKETETYCTLKDADKEALLNTIKTLGLSARAYHRLLRVAATIASLRGSRLINREDVMEALSYSGALVSL